MPGTGQTRNLGFTPRQSFMRSQPRKHPPDHETTMPFHKLDKAMLRDEGFTHTGLLNGLVPVYCGDLEAEQPIVTTSDWVPEFWLDIVDFVFSMYAWMTKSEMPFVIEVTGEIDFSDDDDCDDAAGAHTPCFHHSY